MDKSHKDFNALSQEDKDFIEKGGVIVRPVEENKIECITYHKPYWHVHTCCELNNIEEQIKMLYFLLEFAGYKLYKETNQPHINHLLKGEEVKGKKNNEMYVESSNTGYNIMDLDKESLSIIFEALHSSDKIKPGKIINLENKICFEITKE